MRKILPAIFKIILFLILLETFLWIQGKGYLFFQDLKNKATLKERKSFRIICLGDSNTALGKEEGYVAQMSQILNSRFSDISFEVLNKGLPAATSSNILSKVEPWLDEYNPDIVTVMMGANDRVDLVPKGEESLGRRVWRGVMSLKTVRLAAGLFGKAKKAEMFNKAGLALAKKKAQTPIVFRRAPKPYFRYLAYAMQLNDQKEWAQAVHILEQLVVLKTEDRIFLEQARNELGDAYKALGWIKPLTQVWHDLLMVNPYNVYATDSLQAFCRDNKGEKEIFDMLHSLLLEKPGNRAFLGLLGMCYAEYGHADMADFYLKQYRQLAADGDGWISHENYLKLAAMLNERGIKGVFIEYPSRSADSLRRSYAVMEGKENFIVVDNEELFKNALDPRKYSEYFKDRNYQDIGHCTPKGDRMLAENVAQAIINRWFPEKGETR